MDITLQNVSVKFFLQTNKLPVSPALFHPVFNRWIQESANSSGQRQEQDVLIDVADYSHMHHGPVMVLIGHHANYSLDNTGGRLGFLYSRKSFFEGSPEEKIADAFSDTLRACKKLEEDPLFKGALKFKGEEAELIINNRQIAPNNEETFRAIQPPLRFVLKILYGDSKISLDRDPDPRKRFTLAIRSSEPAAISTLLNRILKTPTPVAS